MTKVSLYKKLEKELALYMDMLGQASDTIIKEGVSAYPIFVVHKNDVKEVGIPLANMEDIKGHWSVNASTMEEFIAKKIILQEKIDSFKTIYKKPDKFLCLFTLSELGAEYIFLPRNNSKTK